MNKLAFEVYKTRAPKENKSPIIVSLSKNSIVLNKNAREKLNSPVYLEFAFDKDTNTIRIRPSNKDEGIPVKKTKVFAKGFFNYFNLNVPGKYSAQYNADEDALYVNL